MATERSLRNGMTVVVHDLLPLQDDLLAGPDYLHVHAGGHGFGGLWHLPRGGKRNAVCDNSSRLAPKLLEPKWLRTPAAT
mmetsp:Transcript_7439/g.5895  ORF Transcript_7439/g.5895 Transcript_7439/m.5895 type:complete len:80 (-) Transcript_7439:58-297(-)